MKGHLVERSPGHWAIVLEIRDLRQVFDRLGDQMAAQLALDQPLGARHRRRHVFRPATCR